MDYLELTDDYGVKCEKIGKNYKYFLKYSDEDGILISETNKAPSLSSTRTTHGGKIFNIIKTKKYAVSSADEMKDLQSKEFDNFMDKLQKELENDKLKHKNQLKKEESELEEKYRSLYAEFEIRRKEYDYSELQLLGQIGLGLGVDISIEFLKAYLGYLQTVCDLKATYVIALGNQATGKTHTLEQTHRCLPSEYVHTGVDSKPNFFKKYNGQDLTGHIFYLGDLGGDNDDDNTKEMRDTFKQLSTDGYVERGVVDKETNQPSTEYVTGYPSLTYTTVNEDMINTQEKSRASILTPPEINKDKFIKYESFMDTPGVDFELKEQIQSDIECIQGLTWHLKQSIKNYELFNPYMFNIRDYFDDIDDFTRKEPEFNQILLLVAILNNPYTFIHHLYRDEEYNPIDTTLVISRKQDVLNALTVFGGSSGLLPTEIALAKHLCDNFFVYQVSEENKDEDIPFETLLLNLNEESSENIFDTAETDNGDFYIYDWDSKFTLEIENENGDIVEKSVDCFFTIDVIKENFKRSRWYKNVKDTLSSKLSKLYDYGILIKLGKTRDGRNVYGIHPDADEKLGNIRPRFERKRTNEGKKVFKRKFPDFYDEFNEMVTKDAQLQIKKVDLEILNSKLYNLPWED